MLKDQSEFRHYGSESVKLTRSAILAPRGANMVHLATRQVLNSGTYEIFKDSSLLERKRKH